MKLPCILKLMILPICMGNASHFNQAAQLNVHGQPKCCQAMLLIWWKQNWSHLAIQMALICCILYFHSNSLIFINLLYQISNSPPPILSLLLPLPFLFLWVWPPCGPVWCGSCAHCWPWSCSAQTGARSAGPAADCAASGTACAALAQSHTWRSLWAAGCVGGCTEFGTVGT